MEKINEKVRLYVKDIKRYLRQNNMYESIDIAVVRNLGDSYKTVLLAADAIDKYGLMIETDKGLDVNKAYKVKNDAIIRMEKCLEILGVQGKQRYKEQLQVDTKSDESLIDKMMRGGY